WRSARCRNGRETRKTDREAARAGGDATTEDSARSYGFRIRPGADPSERAALLFPRHRLDEVVHQLALRLRGHGGGDDLGRRLHGQVRDLAPQLHDGLVLLLLDLLPGPLHHLITLGLGPGRK